METHWSSISIPGALDVPEVFMDDVLLYDVPEIFIPEIFIDDVLLYFRGLGTVGITGNRLYANVFLHKLPEFLQIS